MADKSFAPADVLSRIRQLERELLDLRRALAPVAERVADHTALTLGVGDAWYAVDVTRIVEVVPMAWAEPVPEAPAWVRGTLVFGDDVVPVVDLRARLGGPLQRPEIDQRIVLVGLPRLAGIAVDRVGRLVRVESQAVHPPPEGIPQAPFITGGVTTADLGLVYLLHLERLTRDGVWETGE